MQPIDSIREYGVSYITNNVQDDIVLHYSQLIILKVEFSYAITVKNINALNFDVSLIDIFNGIKRYGIDL